MTRKFLAAAATAVALAVPLASAEARTNEQLIRDTHVNGLCGKGLRTCMWWTISIQHKSKAADGWHVYRVRYYETLAFAGPDSVRRCHVENVSARYGQKIGSPTRPDYCWK